jgi:hypothetical protein
MRYYELFLKILLTFEIFSNNLWISSEEKVLACAFFTLQERLFEKVEKRTNSDSIHSIYTVKWRQRNFQLENIVEKPLPSANSVREVVCKI